MNNVICLNDYRKTPCDYSKVLERERERGIEPSDTAKRIAEAMCKYWKIPVKAKIIHMPIK